jgi:hypothetical protein
MLEVGGGLIDLFLFGFERVCGKVVPYNFYESRYAFLIKTKTGNLNLMV